MRSGRRGPSAAALALAAAALLAPGAARAQDPADLPPPGGDQPTAARGLDLVTKRAFWARSADPRPFVSAVLEAGVIYFRPNIAIGWGRPHWSWIGLEGYASVATSGGAEYVGLRAALAAFEIRGGVRYAFPVGQYFLRPELSYSRDDTERELGPPSRYAAGELEVSGSVPLLGGSLFAVASGYAIAGVPDGYYMFEEALHVVMEPPLLWRARLGFLGPLDPWSELRLGASVELIGNPGRDALVVRLGPAVSVTLTHHLDAVGSLMVVAGSPDTLGLLGADLGQLGLRYRWATGDRWPEFP